MTDDTASARQTTAEALAAVPPAAALLLRDHMRGLEAQAGTARAETRAVRVALELDVSRLRLFAAGLKEELAIAEKARDDAESKLAEARLEIAELQALLAASSTQSRGLRSWTAR